MISKESVVYFFNMQESNNDRLLPSHTRKSQLKIYESTNTKSGLSDTSNVIYINL